MVFFKVLAIIGDGLHFIVAVIIARISNGNILASLLGTFFGNPLTYFPIGVISIKSGNFIFKQGDQVMHLKNNYEKDVFNGDIGIVHEIKESDNRVMVNYDNRIVEYDTLELDELTLAYAISVHKSQGSEYSAVIIALTVPLHPIIHMLNAQERLHAWPCAHIQKAMPLHISYHYTLL